MTTPEEIDPLLYLALMVVRRAVMDAHQSGSARRWLNTTGRAWLDAMGFNFDPDTWRRWVNAGCPGGTQRNRAPPPAGDPIERMTGRVERAD